MPAVASSTTVIGPFATAARGRPLHVDSHHGETDSVKDLLHKLTEQSEALQGLLDQARQYAGAEAQWREILTLKEQNAQLRSAAGLPRPSAETTPASSTRVSCMPKKGSGVCRRASAGTSWRCSTEKCFSGAGGGSASLLTSELSSQSLSMPKNTWTIPSRVPTMLESGSQSLSLTPNTTLTLSVSEPQRLFNTKEVAISQNTDSSPSGALTAVANSGQVLCGDDLRPSAKVASCESSDEINSLAPRISKLDAWVQRRQDLSAVEAIKGSTLVTAAPLPPISVQVPSPGLSWSRGISPSRSRIGNDSRSFACQNQRASSPGFGAMASPPPSFGVASPRPSAASRQPRGASPRPTMVSSPTAPSASASDRMATQAPVIGWRDTCVQRRSDLVAAAEPGSRTAFSISSRSLSPPRSPLPTSASFSNATVVRCISPGRICTSPGRIARVSEAILCTSTPPSSFGVPSAMPYQQVPHPVMNMVSVPAHKCARRSNVQANTVVRQLSGIDGVGVAAATSPRVSSARIACSHVVR